MNLQSAKLIHIYSMGRFGPERHIGFIITETTTVQCIRDTSNIGWDVVREPIIPKEFFSNPLSLSGPEYRKWRNKHRVKWWQL